MAEMSKTPDFVSGKRILWRALVILTRWVFARALWAVWIRGKEMAPYVRSWIVETMKECYPSLGLKVERETQGLEGIDHERPILLIGPHPFTSVIPGMVEHILDLFGGKVPRVVADAKHRWQAIPLAIGVKLARGMFIRKRKGDSAVSAIKAGLANLNGERAPLFMLFPDRSRPFRGRRADALRFFHGMGYPLLSLKSLRTLAPSYRGTQALIRGVPGAQVVFMSTAFSPGLEPDGETESWDMLARKAQDGGTRALVRFELVEPPGVLPDEAEDQLAIKTWLYERFTEANEWILDFEAGRK